MGIRSLRHRLIPLSLRTRLFPVFAGYMSLYHRILHPPPPSENFPPIYKSGRQETTRVDQYWGEHTVNSRLFGTAKESLEYLDWRMSIYPLLKEFMELYGDHKGKTVLDYGCGPANDLIGFLQYSGADKVIGVDVSEKALRLSAYRVALHAFPLQRVQLMLISDSSAHIPLDDNSVDYINCSGVLHHTSNELDILKELYRVLKPGGTACIMVYNYDSLFVHLYVAYERMILKNAYPGDSLAEVFRRSTDGEDCPISRYNRPDEYIARCQQAGFKVEYVGGYLSDLELEIQPRLQAQALADQRLSEEHRQFLKDLTRDDKGYPLYHGYHAGIGGVYRLRKSGVSK